MFLSFLPETLRALVGNGSVPPPRIHTALVPIIGRSRWKAEADVERPPPRNFQNPLTLFLYPDVTLLLSLNAIVNSVYYAVTASLSTIFQQTYPHLSETETGLCYLALGGGMLIASVTNGRLLDRDYRKVREEMLRKRTTAEKGSVLAPEDVSKDEEFPIELARIRMLPLYLIIFICCVLPYGWALQQRVSIAVPLILQIFSENIIFSEISVPFTDTYLQWVILCLLS